MDPLTIGMIVAGTLGCSYAGDQLLRIFRVPSQEQIDDEYMDKLNSWAERFKPADVRTLDVEQLERRIESALEGDPWKELSPKTMDYILGLTEEVPEGYCSRCGNNDYAIVESKVNPFDRKRNAKWVQICEKCYQLERSENRLARTPCAVCKRDSMTLSASGVCAPCRAEQEQKTCTHKGAERVLYPDDPTVYYHCHNCGHIKEVSDRKIFRNPLRESIVVPEHEPGSHSGIGHIYKELRPGESYEVSAARYEELSDIVKSQMMPGPDVWDQKLNQQLAEKLASGQTVALPEGESYQIDQRGGSILRF